MGTIRPQAPSEQTELRADVRELTTKRGANVIGGPTYLFLDTEWADARGSELVSIALVSEDGELEFYAERDLLPALPTDFVRRAVYPLLDRGDSAMSDAEMTTALRSFLAKIHEPYVLADYPTDLHLFQYVLADFARSDSEDTPCGSISPPVMTLMQREGLTTILLEKWFSSNPAQAARRHHALVDARALRMAWLAATGRIPADW